MYVFAKNIQYLQLAIPNLEQSSDSSTDIACTMISAVEFLGKRMNKSNELKLNKLYILACKAKKSSTVQ